MSAVFYGYTNASEVFRSVDILCPFLCRLTDHATASAGFYLKLW